MGAAQVIYIVLLIYGLIESLEKHGKLKVERYNFWFRLFATAIEVAILKWGGFF